MQGKKENGVIEEIELSVKTSDPIDNNNNSNNNPDEIQMINCEEYEKCEEMDNINDHQIIQPKVQSNGNNKSLFLP